MGSLGSNLPTNGIKEAYLQLLFPPLTRLSTKDKILGVVKSIAIGVFTLGMTHLVGGAILLYGHVFSVKKDGGKVSLLADRIGTGGKKPADQGPIESTTLLKSATVRLGRKSEKNKVQAEKQEGVNIHLKPDASAEEKQGSVVKLSAGITAKIVALNEAIERKDFKLAKKIEKQIEVDEGFREDLMHDVKIASSSASSPMPSMKPLDKEKVPSLQELIDYLKGEIEGNLVRLQSFTEGSDEAVGFTNEILVQQNTLSKMKERLDATGAKKSEHSTTSTESPWTDIPNSPLLDQARHFYCSRPQDEKTVFPRPVIQPQQLILAEGGVNQRTAGCKNACTELSAGFLVLDRTENCSPKMLLNLVKKGEKLHTKGEINAEPDAWIRGKEKEWGLQMVDVHTLDRRDWPYPVVMKGESIPGVSELFEGIFKSCLSRQDELQGFLVTTGLETLAVRFRKNSIEVFDPHGDPEQRSAACIIVFAKGNEKALEDFLRWKCLSRVVKGKDTTQAEIEEMEQECTATFCPVIKKGNLGKDLFSD